MPDIFGEYQHEYFARLISDNAPDERQEIIDLISRHDTKDYKKGLEYYLGNSDIKKRVMYTYDSNGNQIVDEDVANHKLGSSFFKMLIDQKVSYLAGEPPTITSTNDDLLSIVNEILKDDFEDTLPELILNASVKGREWLHVYIDEKGEFNTIIIPSEQVIPIYDEVKGKKLEGLIRYYKLNNRTKVEYWTKNEVFYYEISENDLVQDIDYPDNPNSHFNNNGQGISWGEVPFIEFMNNEFRKSDLTFVKDFIDSYDRLISDGTNTLDEMQNVIYVLKGYEGQDLEQFKTDLKKHKAISLSDEPGAGFGTERVEMPTTAYKTQLDILKENIFMFGQGVNPSPDVIGNAPSGIALKNLYSTLDFKASLMERKFKKSLRLLLWFICEYLKYGNKGIFNYKELDIEFNKLTLTNEMEIMQMAQLSESIISKQTILENHPWVKDVALERERLEEDLQNYKEFTDDMAENISDDESLPE